MSNSTQSQFTQAFDVSNQEASELLQTATILQHPRNRSVSEDASTLVFPASMNQVAQQLSSELGFTCNPNTLRTRWMKEKILPAYANLKCPVIKDENGSVTEFGYSAIRDFIKSCIVGQNGFKIAPEQFREQLEETFEAVKVVDPLEEINKLRASINADKTTASQEISALAVRNDTTLAKKEAAEKTATEFAEMMALEKERAEMKKQAEEAESDLALKTRILAKLLREKAIEDSLRAELGMGK